jgi:integrase
MLWRRGKEKEEAGGQRSLSVRALVAALEADYRVNGRRSWRRVRAALRNIAAYFGEATSVATITTAQLTAYVAARMETVARGTIWYELTILRRAMNLLRAYGQLASLPNFPKIRQSDPRQGFLEDAQLDAIIAHLVPELVPVIRWLAITGWRIGEALGLQWSQIDWESGSLRIERTKNDSARTLPWRALPELEQLLRAQRTRADAIEALHCCVVSHVFCRASGTRIVEYGRHWRAACRAAGLPGRYVHDLRRTAVRRLERAGVPRSVAMRITGHKTERIYSRYAITAEKDICEALERLRPYLSWTRASVGPS